MTIHQLIPAKPAATAPPLIASLRGGLLQREFACGGAPGPSGQCAECETKKWTVQRQAHGSSSPRAGLSPSRIPALQPKLTIGASNDPLEREADRVAEQVLAAPAQPAVSEAPPHIQRLAGQSTGQADSAPASVDVALSNPGNPLPAALRQDMEQRFGHDFSRVRVHSGTAAEQSAREVNARAYTAGDNMVFGAGQFAPATDDGRRLIAHELTHVVQQTSPDRIRPGRGSEDDRPSPVPSSSRPPVPARIQRKGSGAVCTGITIRLPDRITFEGTEGPIQASVKTSEELQPGTYTVSYDAAKGQLFVDTAGGTLLDVSVTAPRDAKFAAGQARFNAYLQSLSTPRTLTVIAAGGGGSGGAGSSGSTQTSKTQEGEGEPKKSDVEKDVGQKGGIPGGTGTKTPEKPGQNPSDDPGGGAKGGAKVSADLAAKLKALLDGTDTKTLEPDIQRQVESILATMTLDDIALFKKFAVRNPGGDPEGFLRSLRLFMSTKDVYEAQEPPEAQPADKSQEILADALKQYRDDMPRDEKEDLARATMRRLSNEQLRNITAAQIAEGMVRVDKQLKGMSEDMSSGLDNAIKGTGWERVAGIARGVKGAASFWSFLSFAALIFVAFIPGLNVLALTASAFAGLMVAYAAANLEEHAEVKLAGGAKSRDDFAQHNMAGAKARTDGIISFVGMALPIAGKLIGRIPLPGGLRNVSTALQAARTSLKQSAGRSFASVKVALLETLSKANADFQPYTAQIRQNVASIVSRLRNASGADFIKEIRSTPELQDVLPPDTIKAIEGLKPAELEVAKKGLIQALDAAPDLAEATIVNIQAETAALESRVKAATSADQLEGVLGPATTVAEPERLVTAAGNQAAVDVVQGRAARASGLSAAEVRDDLLGSIKDVGNLPNDTPNRASVLQELRDLLKRTNALEQTQKKGAVDVTGELEEIDLRHRELDDLVADPIAKANESRQTQIEPATRNPAEVRNAKIPTATTPSRKVKWVEDEPHMSPDARRYEQGAPGARPRVGMKRGQVPALDWTRPDGTSGQVKFDGIDGDVLVDRKTSVTTFESSKNQALRQSEALRQNGYTGRWEVPDQAEAAIARKLFSELAITNITVKVVPR